MPRAAQEGPSVRGPSRRAFLQRTPMLSSEEYLFKKLRGDETFRLCLSEMIFTTTSSMPATSADVF